MRIITHLCCATTFSSIMINISIYNLLEEETKKQSVNPNIKTSNFNIQL